MKSIIEISVGDETKIFREMGSTLGVRALQNVLLLSVIKIAVPIIKRNTPIWSGDTQDDVRAKIVDRGDLFSAKVIVGIDARKGHAGWRTHMIRNKGSETRNMFVERSMTECKTRIEDDISKSVDTILEKFNRKLA